MIGCAPGHWSATGTYPEDGGVEIVDNLVASGTAWTAKNGATELLSRPNGTPAAGGPGMEGVGGAITGEHGIVLAKKPWIHQALGPVAFDVHQALKDAVDPQGILNPGKFLHP